MLEEEKGNLEKDIPIPSVIHKIKPNFFPPRDQKFRTKLPNGRVIKTKVSQEGARPFKVIHSQIFVNGCLN